MKRNASIQDALDFDAVQLKPGESNVKPAAVNLETRLTRGLKINLPVISAGRANVTESAMAITLAHLGGLGIIHGNMPLGKQVEEVRRVKRAEAQMVLNPITISPEASIAEAMDLMTTYKVSGLPVVQKERVVGIITSRDVRFFEDYAKPVSELMTKEVVAVTQGATHEVARKLMHQHRIEKLVVVDNQGRCVGLITVKDIDKLAQWPGAARDKHGRLRVGAAVGLGKDAFDRAGAMVDAGLDALFIDVPHAHGKEALGTVSHIRQQRTSEVQIVAGNVSTPEAARSLVDAGADAIMVGPDVPQFSAVLAVVEQCGLMGVPVIVNGGVASPEIFPRAIGAGAEVVAFDALFAGTDEAPGSIVQGEDGARKNGVPYRGPVESVVKYLTEGLRSSMAYVGGADIPAFIAAAEFVKKA